MTDKNIEKSGVCDYHKAHGTFKNDGWFHHDLPSLYGELCDSTVRLDINIPTNETIANEIADLLDAKWGATDDNLGVVMDVFETLHEAGYEVVRRVNQ